MGRSENRRRQFFIKKEFQGKFILLYALATGSIAGLVAFLFYRNGQRVLIENLYRSHFKAESSGEMLSDLLLKTNVFAVIAIIVVVIVLSFIVFRRLNVHFFRMEKRLDAMARGDFHTPPQPASHFNEISQLIDLVQTVQRHYGERFQDLAQVLDEIERACRGEGEPERLRAAKEKLRIILAQVSLPE